MCVTRRSVALVENVGYNNLITLHVSQARTVTCEQNDLFDCYITCHSCSDWRLEEETCINDPDTRTATTSSVVVKQIGLFTMLQSFLRIHKQ